MIEKFLKYMVWASAFFTAAYVALPLAMRWLLAVMALDILVGTARAIIQHTLSSSAGWNGILKKIITLGVIALVSVIDDTTRVYLYTGMPLELPVIGYYIGIEALSILENAVAAGVPVPDRIRSVLAVFSPEKNIDNGKIIPAPFSDDAASGLTGIFKRG